MLYTCTKVFISLIITTVLAHPLGEIHSRVGPSQSAFNSRGVSSDSIWLNTRTNQNSTEIPSVPTSDIIHEQGPGVFPCSGNPERGSAKDCDAKIRQAQSTDYGFIPNGGFRQCMKPHSVKPDSINGTCYPKPVKDDKKSEYMDPQPNHRNGTSHP